MGDVERKPEEELLSLEAAAEFLFVSKSTLYRLLSQGKLRGMKAGKQWRFRREDLEAYLERGPAALALDNLPMEVLDAELAAVGEELTAAGTSAEAADGPALTGEAGKLTQLLRRMVWLLAYQDGSDLHLEPDWEAGRRCGRVRLRVHGRLEEGRRLPPELYEPLVLEWKQWAGLPLDERERPLDGSAQVVYGERLVPLRVSVVPTLRGERVAARTIPTQVPTLAELGLGDSPLNEWWRRWHGLILVTGPSGSGKWTTLAACVRGLVEHGGVNIMAVEETVQFLFPASVAQLKAEHFTSAEGVRAILRQDPDVIVIGELDDDPELARAALQAAETGHLVYSTMLAFDSISPLYELVEAGLRRPALAANLIGVVNQQVFSRLCEACRVPEVVDAGLLSEATRIAAAGGYQVPEAAVFYAAVGCDACGGRGYTGRFGLQECLALTPTLKAAFLRGATADELTAQARREGVRSLFALAMEKAAAGLVTVEEVMRRAGGAA